MIAGDAERAGGDTNELTDAVSKTRHSPPIIRGVDVRRAPRRRGKRPSMPAVLSGRGRERKERMDSNRPLAARERCMMFAEEGVNPRLPTVSPPRGLVSPAGAKDRQASCLRRTMTLAGIRSMTSAGMRSIGRVYWNVIAREAPFAPGRHSSTRATPQPRRPCERHSRDIGDQGHVTFLVVRLRPGPHPCRRVWRVIGGPRAGLGWNVYTPLTQSVLLSP